MSSWLEKYRKFEVEVFYLTDSGFRDRGALADFGDGWVELFKNVGGGETFLIPMTGIRMIRVLNPPGPEERLLRPVEEPAHRIEPGRKRQP